MMYTLEQCVDMSNNPILVIQNISYDDLLLLIKTNTGNVIYSDWEGLDIAILNFMTNTKIDAIHWYSRYPYSRCINIDLHPDRYTSNMEIVTKETKLRPHYVRDCYGEVWNPPFRLRAKIITI